MEQLGGILIAAACGLGLLLVLAVVWLLNPSIQRGTPARAVKRPEALREGSLQIRRMLSDAEAAFYWALKRAVGDRWVILPRVPLHRVFRRIEHLPREMYTMLENGEVDFLLVHRAPGNRSAGSSWTTARITVPPGGNGIAARRRCFGQRACPCSAGA